jgi:hypothetical protein
VNRHCAFILIASLCLSQTTVLAQEQSLDLHLQLKTPFRFVAYGDTRFTDPANTTDTNPTVRQEIVRAVADVHPAFISLGGDIPMDGSNLADWGVYDRETSSWREQEISVYPVLGNHELKGDQQVALKNYFSEFTFLTQHRFYSVRAANILLLTLDSSQDETSGPQGEWLQQEFARLEPSVAFVFVALHHPPLTGAGDKTNGRGGSPARPAEQKLAEFLEQQQKKIRARIVVFASHVHNYERHERNGVTYFVTGGGGAHAYPISRAADDKFQSQEINYHYLLVEVDGGSVKVTMNRIDLAGGLKKWTRPDSLIVNSN